LLGRFDALSTGTRREERVRKVGGEGTIAVGVGVRRAMLQHA